MNRRFVAALISAAAIFVVKPAAAQITVEANGARADERWGGEVGIGYAFGIGGFRLTPSADVLIYAGDNDRYYQDDNGGKPISISSACIAACVPPTTALRWIKAMEREGIVRCWPAEHDKRSRYIALTDTALEMMLRYLDTV